MSSSSSTPRAATFHIAVSLHDDPFPIPFNSKVPQSPTVGPSYPPTGLYPVYAYRGQFESPDSRKNAGAWPSKRYCYDFENSLTIATPSVTILPPQAVTTTSCNRPVPTATNGSIPAFIENEPPIASARSPLPIAEPQMTFKAPFQCKRPSAPGTTPNTRPLQTPEYAFANLDASTHRLNSKRRLTPIGQGSIKTTPPIRREPDSTVKASTSITLRETRRERTCSFTLHRVLTVAMDGATDIPSVE
ncbi:hypothetical protein NMY22_g19951 [Coprinellus aureogranulatus]|nr:hypothetical protein NMY22_g19951 [Coprinellus aureogranulatus]